MKPGIILVRTQLTADPSEFSQAQFNAWYDTQHIPDLLATSGIRAAARYYYSPPAPAGLTTEKAAASADGDSTTMKKSTMPYLAVYWLPDVRWLHEEGCGFWSVPLTVQVTASPNDAAKAAAGQGERDDERQEKSIFELAQVEMEVWEEVKSAKSGEREGAGAEQWAGYQGQLSGLVWPSFWFELGEGTLFVHASVSFGGYSISC
ncbi:hypothetical protein N656DRAFT_299623 [Canariomyces notabilis]|uniref:EthD domain-containing protein n=1 Tax=Canariomyces notabilis TaxID=2074819 RepID=A0AAN6QH85_9PEZI|nr:hypothetical protein N656DRAFT_299623 [Canariomyces arenarius]